MKNTINTFLPIFPGFYGSNFEYDYEQQDIENYNEENETDLNYDDFTFDYKEYNNRVSEKCVEVIEKELQDLFPSIKIEFDELISPKEYNFSNDLIYTNITISDEDFEQIIMYIGLTWSNEFRVFLEEHFKSRSGFSSFVEYDVKTWLNEYLKEDYSKFEMCFGWVLQFILENEEYTMDDLYSGVDSETSYIDYKIIKK